MAFNEKQRKQINAMLYAIEKYPSIGRTKLMKFIFFIDLIFYNESGDTILEDEYERVTYGPVPATGFFLTKYDTGLFKIEEIQLDLVKKMKNFHTNQKCNVDLFNRSERLLFDRILRVLKIYKAEDISNLTHEFDLWKDFTDGDRIPKEKLKLDEFDYEEILSLFAYHEACEYAETLEKSDVNAPQNDETIPPQFLKLQFLTLKGH